MAQIQVLRQKINEVLKIDEILLTLEDLIGSLKFWELLGEIKNSVLEMVDEIANTLLLSSELLPYLLMEPELLMKT